ncbi:MAG: helix-turn-helix transcriptional regulator [Candidatus Nitrotoga sp.]|nr:helix-turn-helix transcriptional regulator [Candidatus Nitrotoga sp.]MDP1856498.1 helix-turn-helix transcriptional regulator [Candidatus Nitrotoga sp.]
MKEFFSRLKKDFNDKEYAHSYMESHAVSRLAAQIFALRKQRGLSQEELATQMDIAQETISKIESGNFNSLTIKTLQKFSRAFDVNLYIAYEPFSHGILDIANLGKEQLEVSSREDDLANKFTEHTRFVNSCGEWKAANYLRGVDAVAPQQPLKPNEQWQSIGKIQEKIAL